jgi:hypothetical protein
MLARPRLICGALGTAALVLAGCSQGADAPSESVETSAGPGVTESVTKACDALLSSDRLLLDPNSDVYEDVLRALADSAQTISDNTQGDVKDQAARLATVIEDAIIEDETSTISEDEEFQHLTQGLHKWGYDSCGFDKLDISATDFLFNGIPEELAAGNYALSLKNTGTAAHVILLVRVSEDIDGRLDTYLDDFHNSVDDGDLEIVVAGAPAPPGVTGHVTATLDPGRYVIVCPIPNSNGVPHFKHGLMSEFTVV